MGFQILIKASFENQEKTFMLQLYKTTTAHRLLITQRAVRSFPYYEKTNLQ